MNRTVLIGLSGIVLGAAGARLWPQEDAAQAVPCVDAPGTATPDRTTRSETPKTPEVPITSSPGSPGGLDASLSACELERAMLSGQLQIYEGEWQDWPADVDAVFSEEGLSGVLSDAWADHAEIEAIDCSEYPCLVTLTYVDDSRSCCTQFSDALPPELQDSGAALLRSHALGGAEPGDPMRAVVVVAQDEHWDDEVARRANWRLDIAVEEIQENDALNAP